MKSIVDVAILSVLSSEALLMQDDVLLFYNISTQFVVRPFSKVYFGLTIPQRIFKDIWSVEFEWNKSN